MAQKLLEPFKKIQHQIQNLNIVQKIHGLTSGRSFECFGSNTGFNGGCLKYPSTMAFEANLGLLAVGTENGTIKIYGSPGTVFPVQADGSSVVALAFIPYEVRLISAFLDGRVTLFDFMPTEGSWKKCCSVLLPFIENEVVTSMTIGRGVVFVGSSTGTLRQIAVKDGRLSLADDVLTACTRAMLSGSVTSDKSEHLSADSPIVSLEMQPNGDNLLIAYADGCVAVAVPQPFPDSQTKTDNQMIVSPPNDTAVAPTAEAEVAITLAAGEEAIPSMPDAAEQLQSVDEANADVPAKVGELDTGKSLPATPVKRHSEKRATLKLRTLTRNWRTTTERMSEAESSPLPVPPSPRITHLLLRDQGVEYATWRHLSIFSQPDEVVVAYGDGAFQVWPVCSAVDTIDGQQSVMEPLVVSKRDPPNMPYGPLPCGAIKKMTVCSAAAGGVLTAFSGGLPRPEFEDRHAVSVLLDQEHHVCFQFGSPVKDFLFVPARKEPVAPKNPIDPVKPFETEPAVALIVLTERELVAVDLMQPTWPTFPAPYLTCLDASPVTALAHVNKVPFLIVSASNVYWPIWGGLPPSTGTDKMSAVTETTDTDLVLLGHSDGSISLLALKPGECTYLVGRLHTHGFFQPLNEKVGPEEESWPPFRRVGMSISPPGAASFNDPRLSVTQLLAVVDQQASPDSGSAGAVLTIVSGGAAGQVTVWSTAGERTPFRPDIGRVWVNLIESGTNAGKYTWAGSSPLKPFAGPIQLAASTVPYTLHLSPCALIQVEPAAAVTALAWERSWQLAAVGTAYGFALVDMLARRPVHADLLLNKLVITSNTALVTAAAKTANSVATMQTAIVQRSKQLSVNVRQSFRRLKHLRTSTSAAEPGDKDEKVLNGEGHPDSIKKEEVEHEVTPGSTEGTEASSEPVKVSGGVEMSMEKPVTSVAVEEKVEVVTAVDEEEAETATLPEPVIVLTDGSSVSECHNIVRSFLFADTFVVTPAAGTPSQLTPCLLVGTSSGRVLAHILEWPGSAGPVTVRLAKELQLQHQAPVIAITAINAISRAPVGPGERNRWSHEPVFPTQEGETCETPAPVTTEQPTVEPTTALEKVSPAISGPVESHQLVVCSTEQVKLFALPTLRALNKHKVVPPTAEQRLHLTHLLHSSSLSKPSPDTTTQSSVFPYVTSNSPSADTVPVAVESTTLDKEQQPEGAVEQQSANDANTKTPALPTLTALTGNRQMHRKSLTGVALQYFTKACGTNEWVVVACRRDGKIVILSLPTLRHQFKAAVLRQSPADIAHVARAGANIVLWWSTATGTAPLVALELSSSPRLTPEAVIVGEGGASCIPVPEWARPRKISNTPKADTKIEEATASTATGDGRQDIPLIDTALQNGEENIEDAVPVQGDLGTHSEVVNGYAGLLMSGEGVTAVGDVTIDTIKEYLNGDDKGQVTVKTIETSTEKHTLVEAGRVVTTLHETETVDGKIVKDDLVKITSNDARGDTVVLQAVTGCP